MTRTKVSPLAFRVFKYTIYLLLAYNIWLFFLEDFAASAQTFGADITWQNVVTAFPATFDTLAWVILLLLFELETAVIPDDKLGGSLKWSLSGIRAVCYFFIIYSLYGYLNKYGVVTNLVTLPVNDACTLIGQGFSYVLTLDEYPSLTPDACVAMQGVAIQQIVGTQIIGTPQQLALAKSLALTDIINASDWLVIVLMLEAEVWLQFKNLLTDRLLNVSKFLNTVLYSILLACAIYWGIDGDFLDFWDAFLWLVAFVFIELNILEWHADVKDNADNPF